MEKMNHDNITMVIHRLLFPEEYDFHHDSLADASDRKKGINPMADTYITERDKLRADLGFGPFTIGKTVGQKLDQVHKQEKAQPIEDTLGWVSSEVVAGNKDKLIAVLKMRGVDVAGIE